MRPLEGLADAKPGNAAPLVAISAAHRLEAYSGTAQCQAALGRGLIPNGCFWLEPKWGGDQHWFGEDILVIVFVRVSCVVVVGLFFIDLRWFS